MNHTPLHLFTVNTADGNIEMVSLLSSEGAFKEGLAPATIVGQFSKPVPANAPPPIENFARNRIFVSLLHNTIANTCPKLNSFINEAKMQKNGWIYVIDNRHHHGDIAPEDILGAFEIKDGNLIQGSYKANPQHRILSASGFFDVGPELYDYLIAAARTHLIDK